MLASNNSGGERQDRGEACKERGRENEQRSRGERENRPERASREGGGKGRARRK